MFKSAHVCGNMVNLGNIVAQHKPGEAKKPPAAVHPAAGQALTQHIGIKLPQFKDFANQVAAHKSDRQAAAPMSDEIKKFAEKVSNMHYGHFPKH